MTNTRLDQQLNGAIKLHAKIEHIKMSKGIFQMPVISIIVYILIAVDILWLSRSWWTGHVIYMHVSSWVWTIILQLIFMIVLYRWYLTIRTDQKQYALELQLDQYLQHFTKQDWIDIYQSNQFEYLKYVSQYVQLQKQTNLSRLQYEYQNQLRIEDLKRTRADYQKVVKWLKILCPYQIDWMQHDTNPMRSYMAQGDVYNLQKWMQFEKH